MDVKTASMDDKTASMDDKTASMDDKTASMFGSLRIMGTVLEESWGRFS